MKALISTHVLAIAAVMATSNASAVVACQTPVGMVPIPQFTYMAGVPCTNGYVNGFTVHMPPPQMFGFPPPPLPIYLPPPVQVVSFPPHRVHVPPPFRPSHRHGHRRHR